MKPFRFFQWVSVAILFSILCVLISPVQATLDVYTDRGAWETAIGSFSTENFEDEPLGPLSVGNNPFDGFSIVTVLNGTELENANAVRDGSFFLNIDGSKFVSLDYDLSDAVSVDSLAFDQPTNAFAADWTSTTNVGGLWMATSAGDTVDFLSFLGTPGNGFLGFISDSLFSDVFFGISSQTLDNEFFGMDNASFASSTPVPEPATLLLLGSGLFGLVSFGRKKFRKK